MRCGFQIFHDNTWKECASLTLLQPVGGNPRTPCIFEYDLDYAFEAGAVPLSFNFPVTRNCKNSIVAGFQLRSHSSR